MNNQSVICLFDVDGTLTRPRLNIEEDMYNTLIKLKKKHSIGLVGGSDIDKISEQMNIFQHKNAKAHLIETYEYVFVENGLIAYEKGKLIGHQSILNHLSEESAQEIINYTLDYLSKLKLPKKRGNFVEFRTGMINISPIGRSCSLEERLEFFEFDKKHKLREKFVKEMTDQFSKKYNMKFSIGGQISIDAFPVGWDKTYCLKYLKDKFKKIYFFGDQTDIGGNDHELYAHKLVQGYKVKNCADTISILNQIFDLQ